MAGLRVRKSLSKGPGRAAKLGEHGRSPPERETKPSWRRDAQERGDGGGPERGLPTSAQTSKTVEGGKPRAADSFSDGSTIHLLKKDTALNAGPPDHSEDQELEGEAGVEVSEVEHTSWKKSVHGVADAFQTEASSRLAG